MQTDENEVSWDARHKICSIYPELDAQMVEFISLERQLHVQV